VKIVIAPDSFKESLTAAQVARAIAAGIRRALPDAECVLVPVADGGEGTVRALVDATGGREHTKRVVGPLGEPVRARYGFLGDGTTAAIEMAAASGLELVAPAARNPLKTTTYGTGQLLRAALLKGAHRIILGIGGSATNDGGAGMAQALGIRFHDRRGRLLDTALTGAELEKVHTIDMSQAEPAIPFATLVVACDVNNRLLGKRGATKTYGPQKGADAVAIERLEQNLAHFADVIARDLGVSIRTLRGGGAAGGLGAGLVAFLDAELRPGAEIVLDAVGLAAHLRDADLLVTGEGMIDAQTAFGKAPAAVAALAARAGVPVVGLGGALSDDANKGFANGFDALESAVIRPMALTAAITQARRNLILAGERIGHWVLLTRRLRDRHKPGT
jgi:glycerate kinase